MEGMAHFDFTNMTEEKEELAHKDQLQHALEHALLVDLDVAVSKEEVSKTAEAQNEAAEPMAYERRGSFDGHEGGKEEGKGDGNEG